MLKRIFQFTALYLTLLTAPLLAQQLNSAYLPVDTQWLIFVGGTDQNLLIKEFLTLLPPDKLKLAQQECLQKFGFDPVMDVRSALMFSDSIANLADEGKEPSNTFVAQVRYDQQKMIKAIAEDGGKDYSTSQYQGHTIHQIPLSKRDLKAKVKMNASGQPEVDFDLGLVMGMTAPYMVLDKPDLIIAGSDIEHLKKTLDVIDGRVPSLAQATRPTIVPKLPAGTFLVFAASNAVWMKTTGFDAEKIKPAAKEQNSVEWKVQLADRGAALIMGESDNHTFLATRLCMQDPATAMQLKMTFEGLRAMLGLSNVNGQTPEAQMMRYLVTTLNAADIAVDQDEIRLTLRVPNEQVNQLIQMAKTELVMTTKIKTEKKQ